MLLICSNNFINQNSEFIKKIEHENENEQLKQFGNTHLITSKWLPLLTRNLLSFQWVSLVYNNLVVIVRSNVTRLPHLISMKIKL